MTNSDIYFIQKTSNSLDKTTFFLKKNWVVSHVFQEYFIYVSIYLFILAERLHAVP